MVDHSYSTHGFGILCQYLCDHSGHQKQTQDEIQPLQLLRPLLPLQPFAADGLSGLPQPGIHALHVTETDPAKGRGKKKRQSRHHKRSKRRASSRAWTAFSCSLASASSLSSCACTVAEDGNCGAQRAGPHMVLYYWELLGTGTVHVVAQTKKTLTTRW